MTDYARVSVIARYGEAATFSDGFINREYDFNATSPALPMLVQNSAPSTGLTVDLGAFTALQALTIKNRSTLYPLHARAMCVKASKTWAANQLTFDAAGNPDTITDAGTTFLTALYALAGDQFRISGCTTAVANNGTWNIQACTAGVATVFAADALAAAAPEAGGVTIVCLSRANLVIPVAGCAVIYTVDPTSDLVLTGIGGTVETEIYGAGT